MAKAETCPAALDATAAKAQDPDVANLLVSDPAREREGCRADGLTEFELHQRTGVEPSRLRRVAGALRRVRFDPETGVYRIRRAAFSPDLVQALLEIELG